MRGPATPREPRRPHQPWPCAAHLARQEVGGSGAREAQTERRAQQRRHASHLGSKLKRSNGKPDFETDGLCFPRGDLTRSGRARARAFMRNHCGPGTGREVQNRPFAFRRRAGAPAAPPAEEADEVDAPADGGGAQTTTSLAEATAHRGRKTGVLLRALASRDSSGMEDLAEFWQQDGLEGEPSAGAKAQPLLPRASAGVQPRARPCVIPSPIAEDSVDARGSCGDAGSSSDERTRSGSKRSRGRSDSSSGQGSRLRSSTASGDSRSRRRTAASPASKASSDMSLCTPSERRSRGSQRCSPGMSAGTQSSLDDSSGTRERSSSPRSNHVARCASVCEAGSAYCARALTMACTRSRTPSLCDNGRSSDLFTSSSLSHRSLALSEELADSDAPKFGSSSTSPNLSGASASGVSASPRSVSTSTSASSASDAASAIWKAMGGGQGGGGGWEADGIWKELDGSMALLRDMEPSIGQQLMTEVRTNNRPSSPLCTLQQGNTWLLSACRVTGVSITHALTVCGAVDCQVKAELVRMLKHHLCSRVGPAIRNQLQKLVSPLPKHAVRKKPLLFMPYHFSFIVDVLAQHS